MPSLIYIARIKNLSEELAQALRSTGCHVKLFKAGDITQDECLLAMTSEAANGALHPERIKRERVTGEAGRNIAGMPPAPELPQTLGYGTAIWNGLETAVAKDLHADHEPVRPVVSARESGLPQADFSAAEARKRVESDRHGKTKDQTVRIAPIEPPPIVAVSSSEVSRQPQRSRPTIERCCRVFRSPLSTVVALLVFGVVYRGLPSTAASARNARQSNSAVAVSAPLPPTSQRAQRHLSLDGFVAADFTNHLALRTQSAAQQNPELKHPQRDAARKRIVVD